MLVVNKDARGHTCRGAVDVSDAEETDLELVGTVSRRHLWWIVAMSVRSVLRAVSEAAARLPSWSREREWRRCSAPSAPQRSARHGRLTATNSGSGGLSTTARDLIRLNQALRAGRLYSCEDADRWWTRY